MEGLGASALGGLASIGGSLFGMLNSNTPTPPPQGYQPQNQGWADNSAMSGISQLGGYNTAGQSLPQYGTIAQQGVNNPYASQFQTQANTLAPMAWNTGLGQVGAGGATINSGLSMLPYAQSILQAGFDPLGNVYNQQHQQNTDQTRAGLEARGLNTSPFGAGVENQSNINFNNTWDQNALARMSQGAQGAATLNNSNVAAINAGTGIQTAGLNQMNTAAGLPYATANTISGNQLGFLDRYGGAGTAATNTGQQSIQDLLAYLGVGNQAAGVANQGYANQITAQNNQFNQSQTLGKNLGAGIQGVFGNKTGGFNWGGSSSPAVGNPTQLGGLY